MICGVKRLIQLLKNYTDALAFGFEEGEEMDSMKVRCTFCLMQYGGAYLTTKVKLKTINHHDYLVCKKHDWVKHYHLKEFKHDEQGKRKINS